MATCPRCGNKRIALEILHCPVCGKAGCDKCFQRYGHLHTMAAKPVPQRVCSTDCFDRWAWSFISQGHAVVATGPMRTLYGVDLAPAFAERAQRMAEAHQRDLQLTYAKNLIAAERFEDAAKVYEGLSMWKEAGEIRRLARRPQIVTQVHLDVNDLIEQLRKSGVSTSYTCPACGSPIRISGETSLVSLRSCQYCGSVLQTTDLVEFLTKVVGYP